MIRVVVSGGGQMGRVAVEAAVRSLKGERPAPETTVRIELVTRENVQP